MAYREGIQALVDALRSGEFEQGYSYLKMGNRYCCLGVACEIAIRNGVELHTATLDGVTAFNSRKVDLPAKVSAWFNLEDSDPTLKVPPALYERRRTERLPVPMSAASTTTAIALNDTFNFSFAEIADCFEHTYLQPVLE